MANLSDQQQLELCVSISGAFEGGTPHYTDLTGNFDGQGLSAGILQWNAGQGTLQGLLINNIAPKMGWDKMQTFFHSDIHHFAMLRGQDAITWCLDHYIQTGTTHIDPAAQNCWVAMLNQPESIAGQVEAAKNWQLMRANKLAAQYVPDHIDSTRCLSFFFDVVVQEGGMITQHGSVDPLPAGSTPDISAAMAVAQQNSPKTYAIWQAATASDQLAQLLVYYGYSRAMLGNQTYLWDALSRRGSIACRGGIVHATLVDFTLLLD